MTWTHKTSECAATSSGYPFHQAMYPEGVDVVASRRGCSQVHVTSWKTTSGNYHRSLARLISKSYRVITKHLSTVPVPSP